MSTKKHRLEARLLNQDYAEKTSDYGHALKLFCKTDPITRE